MKMETTPPPPHVRRGRPKISRDTKSSGLALPPPLLAPGGAGGTLASRKDLLLLLGGGEGEFLQVGLLLLLLQGHSRKAGARHLDSKN